MGNYGKIQIVGGLSDKDQAKGQRYPIWRVLEDGTKVEVTSFANMEEMQWAMELKNKETGKSVYDTDATFRQSVEGIAANSPELFAEPTLARRSGIPSQDEFMKAAKMDALRQKREQLSMEAGGSDAIAKYNAMLQLTDPTLVEAFAELEAATEEARPMEYYLKQRKQQGLPPMKTYDIDEALNTDTSGIAQQADENGNIITIGE